MTDFSQARFCAPPHPRIVPVPAFSDNYLWLVLGPDGAGAAVVDPGDARPVIDALAAHKRSLRAILLTHKHPDHVGGVAELVRMFGCPVYGPVGEPIESVTEPLDDGDTVRIDAVGLVARVIAVPGHTLGHIAYACEPFGHDPRPVLFCGDTLFAGGCGRVFEGTSEQMTASLSSLASLAPQTLVYCAHEYTVSNLRFAVAVEPDNVELGQRMSEAVALREVGIPTVPSTIGIELGTNPFLRTDQASVRAAAQTRLAHPPADRVETFAAIRGWKNEFR